MSHTVEARGDSGKIDYLLTGRKQSNGKGTWFHKMLLWKKNSLILFDVSDLINSHINAQYKAQEQFVGYAYSDSPLKCQFDLKSSLMC